MKKINILLFMLGLLGSLQPVFSQNLSNKGKDFWVGYGHHQFMEPGQNNSQEMILYFSAEQAANVTVSINGITWVRNYFVPANTVIASDLIPKSGAADARLISLPCTFVPPGFPCGGEGTFGGKAIHIVSDVPIVAYAHIYGSASSGATMLMPVETWGYSYVTLNSKQSYAPNCFSWAYAIAEQDNTVIEITPTAVTRSGKPANVPYTVTLNRGEIYQLMAGPEGGSVKPELSGTKIKSIDNGTGICHPIAVFSGSSRTSNPAPCGSGGGDNDNQQCFPSQAWGKRYLTAPTSNSNTPSTPMWNTFKVAVKDPTTQVWRNGTLLTPTPTGYYEFNSNTADYITADKPIMVAQYMTGGNACQGGGGVGDPEMMYISPVEQGIKRIGFYRNNREAITVNYLTLIIPTAGVPSLRIDGSAAFDHSYPHPNLSGYTVVIKKWSAAQAQAIAFSDSAFTAITYGLGTVESYGYNAGTLINNLSAVGSIFNVSDSSGTVTSHPFTCDNTPLKLSVLLGYATPPTKLVWKLSSIPGLTPNADVTDNSPTPEGTQVIGGITYFKFSIPGTYSFANTGTFTIPIYATHPSIENCNNTERVFYEIEVRGKPIAGFTYTHTGCISDPVQFSAPAVSANGFTLSQWIWTYPGGSTDNMQNPSHVFSATGNQNVNLHLISAEGCVNDTTKAIPIFPRPTASIQAVPATVCEGGSITLTGSATFGGTAPISNYYWNFGTGTSTTVGPHSVTFPNWGSYTIQHTEGVTAACISDTTTKVVTVFAKPTTTFSYPVGCLPSSGTVQFTSMASAPDGQAITGHSWNFGDPGSGANNTSTLANPTHTYSTVGNYTITYSVTTANGCTKDTTVNATFNLPAALSYPSLAPVCQSVAGTVSVATATVTNGVPGTGVYSGPGTDAAGNFNPSVAGAGTHTITYTFTSTAGCATSITQTIAVSSKPNASFTYSPNTACIPANGQVQFNYNGSMSAGQTYLWNFNDPNANVGNPNTSTAQNPTHIFSNNGTYNISVTVTNSNGCVDDSVIVATINVTAALAYPALAAVCESAAPLSVATATVTNGVTGTGVYSGPGTSANGMFDPAAAGPGNHTITYTFTSTGGCVSAVTSSITVNAKPNASFTYSPNTACIPANGQVQFNYNGSLSAGQTYLWNFNDPNANVGNPNTSTVQNPTHIFTNTGTYNISVTVTNTNGCVDDSVIVATINVTAALAYPALAAVCESAAPLSVATASVTNGVTGTGVYSGPGTNANGMFDPAAAGAGNHTITYTFTSTGGCVSTVTSSITVNAKPNASFTYTPNTACIPANGQVQFNYNGSLSAGQTYLWNFNDPNANVGNPNTSTAQNPTHIFTNNGTYNISVTVTNSNGCVDDSVIVATLNVTAALAYPALAAVCESAAPMSVATATVTNSVTGNGVYSGPGTSANGMFDPAAAGPGTHTITYTFTSTGGCVTSITTAITVNPLPVSAFAVESDICTDQVATLNNQSTISSGSIVSWNWDFGDGSTAINPNGNSFTHSYAPFGIYEVTLITVSNNGCTSTPVRNRVAVHAVPVSAFTMPASVCLPNSSLNFQNASSSADNASLSYQWDFGDSNNSTEAEPGHVYATAGSYDIQLTVTTQFGCIASSTQNFSAFFDKPNAFFVARPDTVCQGTPVNFISSSDAPNSTISSYKWIFDDGSTFSGIDPVKNYVLPGNYNPKLVVISSQGCVSDTARQRVKVYLQPFVDAGLSVFVAQGSLVQLRGTANSADLTLTWSPSTGLSDNSILNPTLRANADITYTLTATAEGNCAASDQVSIKIFKPVNVPNAFSPNGDGVNDTWQLDNIKDYPGAYVQVFNRYGQMVFNSVGYSIPWDGTMKGKPLPVATYYYVINLKNGFAPMTGPITLIR